MKNADDVLVQDPNEPVLTEEELEVIYKMAKRIARKPRSSLPEEGEDGGRPWWALLGIIFTGSCITMLVLLVLTMPD